MMAPLRTLSARLLRGGLGAAGGAAAVIGVVLLSAALKDAVQPAEKPSSSEGSRIAVPPPPPPPRQKVRRPPPPKPRKPRTSPRRAPAPPSLAGGLASVSLGLGPPAGLSLDAASKGLLGDQVAGQNLVMTESAVDQPPRPTTRTRPVFPPRAQARGLEGAVTLRILVGPNGEVLKVRVKSAAPEGVFESAALQAVRQWRFRPGMYQGQPVKVWVEQVVRFDLS